MNGASPVLGPRAVLGSEQQEYRRNGVFVPPKIYCQMREKSAERSFLLEGRHVSGYIKRIPDFGD
jgi:hypothetical protein